MNSHTAEILRILRESPDFVSGGKMSSLLSISRTAVWKHMAALRRSGYVIDSLASKGYRLRSSPSALSAQAIGASLAGSAVGRRILCLDETSSTNTEAYKAAEEGAPEGTVIFADRQTQGKGRLGRRWESPPGVNIYCSVILRPPIQPHEAPQLTFLSSVAVARAIERATDLKPEIKWPNDLLVGGRKVAGLLNEMSAETDMVRFVILGIGVNLNMTADQFPADLRHPAASLLTAGAGAVERNGFAALLLEELGKLYARFLCEGYDSVRREWSERCPLIGSRVRVDMQGRIIRGTASGIDADGALLVDSGNRLERIMAGDVTREN